MKYVSIDLETTGLTDDCQILEFAAIVDDLSIPNVNVDTLPAYHRFIKNEKNIYSGHPYALAMNKRIFTILDKQDYSLHRFETAQNLLTSFAWWLRHEGGYQMLRYEYPDDNRDFHKGPNLCSYLTNNPPPDSVRIVAGGKNFAHFDLRFIQKLNGFNKEITFSNRFMDPGMLYFDPKIDEEVPGTSLCLKRAGIESKANHEALEDAKDVIKLIRYKLGLGFNA